MSVRLGSILLLMALAAPVSVVAHDPSKHKGKATTGEIVSVTNDRIELKTATGTQTVQITDKTKFERGNQAISAGDLKKGDRVLVYGTTLASGELVSREILIAPPDSHAGHKNKTGKH